MGKPFFGGILARSPRKRLPRGGSSAHDESANWVAIELSNYPPTLTRSEIHALFSGFNISSDFALPEGTNFTYPFRTTLWIFGAPEARMAVEKCDGLMVDERKIMVKLIEDKVERQDLTSETSQLVDELKSNIIETAQVYMPNLRDKLLDIYTHTHANAHYAFLQCRDLVTAHSDSTEHLTFAENNTSWEYVVAGTADVTRNKSFDGQLAALQDLLMVVERQGTAAREWAKFKRSPILAGENTSSESMSRAFGEGVGIGI